MSFTLLAFSKSFIKGRINADCFSNCFQELWMIERDNDVLLNDNDALSECLSTTFCLVDLYDPDDDRKDYELNGEELKVKLIELLRKHKL